VIALPLALLARRSRFLSGPVLALSTVIYTIPSLAMFAFIFPFTGLSTTTVLVGLVAYSLVILVRNFLTGLQGVPADVREAARGMGYGSARMFLQVDLPLALPLVMTGVRTAAVQVVATAGLAALVGGGGLGQIINLGFGQQNYGVMIAGAVLVAALALLTEVVLVLLAWALTPGPRRLPWTGPRAATVAGVPEPTAAGVPL
jgi:osmoprotectant transport system permease protein